MRFSRIFKFLTLFAFIFVLLSPRPVHAASTGIFSSPDSIVVKVQETIEYFFAFRVEKKVEVLEKHAEKRLIMAQGYAEKGNNKKVQNLLQNYQQIKERQNNLLGKINDGEVLGVVAERTIEQQKTMEKMKTKVEGEVKQVIIQTQEKVVNQVAQRIIVKDGKEGAAEFFNKVEHVWAPGTGPGGKAGVVVVGGELKYAPGTGPGGQGGVVIVGSEMKFAPGTSAGGPATQDIKTVEIKTGGTVNEPAPVGSGQNMAPGTTSGGNTDTTEGGSRDYAPGTTSGGESGIAP